MGDYLVSLATLQARFPGKRFTRVFNRTKHNKLSFNQQVLYTQLMYREARGKGASQKTLARSTGIDRGETVRDALKALEKYGLAAKRGNRWYGVPPAGDTVEWF